MPQNKYAAKYSNNNLNIQMEVAAWYRLEPSAIGSPNTESLVSKACSMISVATKALAEPCLLNCLKKPKNFAKKNRLAVCAPSSIFSQRPAPTQTPSANALWLDD